MYEGLVNGLHNLSSVTPSCSTGNCSWTEYSSLGMCAKVVDLSGDILNNPCNTTALDALFELTHWHNPGYPCYNYTLPYIALNLEDTAGNDILLANISISSAASSPSEFDSDTSTALQVLQISQAASNNSLISYYMIYQPGLEASLTNSSFAAPLAYSITLDFCLQTYNTTVSNGLAQTILTSSRIFDVAVSNTVLEDDIVYEPVSNYSSITVEDKIFTVSDVGAASLALSSELAFWGPCYQDGNGDASNKANDVTCTGNVGATIINAMRKNSTDPLSTVSEVADNVATSLTNA